MLTLGERLEAVGGRPSGFDYLRLALALQVVIWHASQTTYGERSKVWENPFAFSAIVWVLPAFFALSGFLVAGSLERCKTLAGFLYLRTIRIAPALVVEVVVSALVLGPLLTTLPLHAYFHNQQFFHYFLNCVGNIHYSLPGVFLHNPLPGVVNRQLWTIPWELKCYIIVAILGVVGFTHNRWLLSVAVLALYAKYIILFRLTHIEAAHVPASGQDLLMAFLFGVLFYSFRQNIPHSRTLAILAFAVAAALFVILPNGRAFASPFVAYVVAFLGLTNPRKIVFLESGADYSYGIYLYSFPVQQLIATIGLDNAWANLALALPPVLLLAAGSWHFWEKRCLELRRFRAAIDRWFAITGPGWILRRIYRMAVPIKV